MIIGGYPSLPITEEWRAVVLGRMRERGWNQTDLADRVDATQSTISLILTGRQPNSTYVLAIEAALGLRPQPCLRCGSAHHRTDQCTEPPLAPSPAPPAEPRILTAAELRLELDARDLETRQYEDVIRTCGIRIAENRARRIAIEAELVRLREGGTP